MNKLKDLIAEKTAVFNENSQEETIPNPDNVPIPPAPPASPSADAPASTNLGIKEVPEDVLRKILEE